MCLAVPGKIVSIERREGELGISGVVNFGGVLRSVNLTLVPEVEVGDYVVVHVGVALCKLDEAAAERTLAALAALLEVSADEVSA